MKKIWSTLLFLFFSAIFYFTNPDPNNFGVLASSMTGIDSEMELANNNLRNDPPVLLSPIGEIEQRSSQFYNFIWQPRHTTAAVVEYELFIFERIRGLSDQQIVSVTAPVFRTRTLATSYLYSPKDPILKTEQDYLVLIKVQDVKASIYFKNNGRSKIETFRIKTRCVPGEGCDDGKECTFNDRITIDCECKGTPYYDVDQDGTCDPVLLPPPLVVSPERGVVDIDTPKFTTAWEKQHDYDLDIDYQLNIRQTGVDVEETEAYQQLISKLEKEKVDFFQKLEKNETAFYNEQKDKSADFESSLLDGDVDCSLAFEETRLVYEEQVITKEKAFDKTIQSVVDNCPTDTKKATNIFNEQLSRERTEFEALQKDAQQIFDAQHQGALAALQAKQKLERENLKTVQAKDLALFSKKIEIKSFENCGVYETSQADFDERKKELRAQRDACLTTSEDYKSTVKEKAKTQLKSLKEDEEILKIARGLAKDKYEQLIQDLTLDLDVKLKNADTEALRALVNKDHNNALVLAKAEYEETLRKIDQRTTTNKKEQDNVKRQRDKDLKNVDQKIEKLKRNCKRTFREAVDLLEKEQLISEGKLEECLNQIDQDSKLFSEAQRETWNNLEINHQNELKKFNQKQEQNNNRFNQSQETALKNFNSQLKNRRALFDAEIANCLLKVDQQKNLYTQSQTFQQAHFEATQLMQSDDCQRRSNDLATKFMESQATTLLIYEREKEQKIKELEETQKDQISQLVDELTTEPANAIVYAKKTKELSETISLTEAGLKKGYKYVAQVQAADAKQIATFQNDGLSNLWPLQTGKVNPPTRNFFKKDSFSPPRALPPVEIEPRGFTAIWSTVEGVSYYLLEVSDDINFKTRLKGYDGIKVYDGKWRIEGVDERLTYYYRVQSGLKGEISAYSNRITHRYERSVPCKPGTPCDDKDPCTVNDRITEKCLCQGTNEDLDKDGICDGLDICPGGDDREDVDGDKIPDFCDDCVVGTACSDGDTMTVLDRWIHNPAVDPTQPPPPGVEFCLCQGIPRDQAPCKDKRDTDKDGICDEWDLCPGHDDFADADEDGVPDGCDKCRNFDDSLDEDGDGIPDGCDTSPEGCDATLAICATETTVIVCNYYYYLDPVQDLNCSIGGIRIQEPGKEEATMLSEISAGGIGFGDNYCLDKDCGENSLEKFATQLNRWIANNGFQGDARIHREIGSRKWIRLGFFNTNLKLVDIQKGCTEKNYKRRIYERRCREVTRYILTPAIIGACEDPTYEWSTGATTQRIMVPSANHVAYTVTVTCDDQCIYTTAKLEDYACTPGELCNDGDPCTINDKLNSCCECIGTYSGDSDLDGVCDELDRCPGVDDNAVGKDCEIICDVGQPCDDRDTCTINDVYVFLLKENRCDCRGTYVDSDGDFVCDPLDQCPGHPDSADADLDGTPDGCENPGEICLNDQNQPLDYCEAIQAFSKCIIETDDGIDDTEQFVDLVELSNMLVQLVSDNPEAILDGELIITGTDLEGGTDIEIGELEDGDLSNNSGGTFDVDLIITGTGTKKDSDGDGVCDLLDICSGSDVDTQGGNPSTEPGADPSYRPDGIPDGCPDCVGLTTDPVILALYLDLKFDRFCYAQIPPPDGSTGIGVCEVPGELNCACECIPVSDDWDADADGVCNDLDQCHGGNDLEDWDGDGIPNACEDEDPCPDPDEPIVDCPPADATCILGGFIAYNDTTGVCECVLIPDGDDDGDGVCNALDKCEGSDDNIDPDGDLIPSGCDLCPDTTGVIGSICDDGEICTTNDVLIYTYETRLLSEVLVGFEALYNAIPNKLDVQSVINTIKEHNDIPDQANPVPPEIWLNMESTSQSGGQYYVLMITGCTCRGYKFDSDYDGVCDGEDICPGFDDNNLENNDYDGDGIPDGCDPPYYEIGCPDQVSFLLDGNYAGIILTFNDPNVIAEQLPLTVDFTFNKATPGELFVFENVFITNIQNLAAENKTKVLFELPFDDINDINEVYHYEGQPNFFGVIAYSSGQFCHYRNGRNIPNAGTSFGCQEEGMFFVENGKLAIGQNFNPLQLIDLNTIPAAITAIELDFSNATFDTGGSVTSQDNTEPGMLLLSTDIAPAEPASDGPLSDPEGFIEFNNGLRCEFGTGGGIVNNCNAQHYIGEPCNDNDPLTAQDRWIIDPDNNTCKCQGLFIHDQDGDGVHDTEDICPGGNDNLDENGDGIPDECECQAPVVATQDFGDGVPVQMIKIRNGNSVDIRLDSLLDDQGVAIHNGYSITWTPVTPPPPADPDEQPITITGQEFIINNLTAGETYSITVTGNCVPGGDPSPPLVIEVIIPSNGCELTTEDMTCNCTTPISNLFVGDVVTIGDFPVTISNVTASGATYSGSGYASLPYFNSVQIEFNFEGITIMDCGDSYCVSAGHMYVPQTGSLDDILGDFIGDFDPFDGNLLDDIQKALEVLKDKSEDINDIDDYNTNIDDLANDIADILPEIPFMNDDLVNGPDGLNAAITCMSNVPDPENFEDCKEDLNDAITALLDHIKNLYDADTQVIFYEDEGQAWGFDKQKYTIHDGNYEQVELIADESYSVSWKSVRAGETDVVKAKKKDGSDVQGLTYKNAQMDDIVPNPLTGENQQITVTGLNRYGAIQEIYAVQSVGQGDPEHTHNPDEHIHIAGKLNLVSYADLTLNVKVVPVNMPSYAVPIADIQEKLEGAFNQAAVTVSVEALGNLNVPGFDGVMDDASTGFLSAYTSEQNDIVDEFTGSSQYQSGDTYYVFLIQSHETIVKRGYMPKKRKFGFVFLDNMGGDNEALGKTVAHEVGHGAFVLAHTHEEYPDNPEETVENKNNLMDYSNKGTNLYKYQWDYIHDPASNFTLFDSDEEAESIFGSFSLETITASPGFVPYTGGTNGCKKFLTSKGKLVEFGPNTYNLATFRFDSNNYLVEVKHGLNTYKLGYNVEEVEINGEIRYRTTDKPTFTRYPVGYTGVDDFYDNGTPFKRYEASEALGRLSLTASSCTFGGSSQIIKKNATGTGTECYTTSQCPSFFIYDLTNSMDDNLKNELQTLFSGEDKIETENGTRHDMKGFLILSAHDVAGSYEEAQNKTISGYTKIWLHKTSDGQWSLPTDYGWIPAASSFFAMHDEYSITSLMQSLGSSIGSLSTGLYEFLDMVSKGLDKIKIPEYVYNDNHPKYKAIYGSVYYVLTLPINAPITLYISTIKAGAGNNYAQNPFAAIGDVGASFIHDFTSGVPPAHVKYQFAFICGVWNGAVDVLKAVPDLLQWVVGFEAKMNKAIDTINKIKAMEFKDENGQSLINCEEEVFWCFLYMMMDQFNFVDPTKRCVAFHNTAGIALGIVAGIVSGGAGAASLAGSTAGKVASTVLKVINKVDDMTDIFGLGLKVARKGLGKRDLGIDGPNPSKYGEVRADGKIDLILEDAVPGVKNTTVIDKADFVESNFTVDANGTIKYKKGDGPEYTLKAKKQGFINYPTSITKWLPGITTKIRALYDRLSGINHPNGGKVVTFQPSSNPTNSNLGKIVYKDVNGQSREVATVQKNAAGEGSYGDVDPLTDTTVGNRVFEQNTPDGDAGIACNSSSCKTFSCGCFASGVLIATDDGGLPNEQVKLGQPVIGYDEEKQDTVMSKVVRLIKGQAQQLVQLFIKDKPIEVVEGHPIYVPAYQRYVAADSLRKGMQLLALSGALLTIDSTAIVASNVPTYDFEIAGVHNYFVGEEQILVHNDNGCNIILKNLGFNQAKRQAILNAITDLELRKQLFDDLKSTNPNIVPSLKDYFINHPNPAKAAEAWEFLSNKNNTPPHSPNIRKDPANLTKLEGILSTQTWAGGQFGIDDVRARINGSNSKSELLTDLNNSTTLQGFEQRLKVSGRPVTIHTPTPPNLTNLYSGNPPDIIPLGSASSTTMTDLGGAVQARINADALPPGAPGKRKAQNDAAEDIAEFRADEIMESAGYQRLKLNHLIPGNGKTGRFDRIYKNPATGDIYIIECKGGTSTYGKKNIKDQNGNVTDVAEQGSVAYRDQIIRDLEDSIPGGSPVLDAIKDARNGIPGAGTLKYILVKQPLTNLSSGLGAPIVKIFP